jgi:hypothetical protein
MEGELLQARQQIQVRASATGINFTFHSTTRTYNRSQLLADLHSPFTLL